MNNNSPEIRLQKAIADAGVTSRRKAEQMITMGRIQVNGQKVVELGTKVNPKKDVIEVDGNAIDIQTTDKMYILLNKPRGYVTTTSDPEGRDTVMDLVKHIKTRLYPVGRLDFYSEGLLLLTNDGELANIIMHPRYEVTKVYEVKVFGVMNEYLLKKLRSGVRFEDGLLKPISVRVIKSLPSKTWLEFRLGEGKNREIRRLCEACDLTIDKLKRVAIEGLSINGIAPGHFDFLTKKQLLKALNLKDDGTKMTSTPAPYLSPKKTISWKKRVKRSKLSKAPMANDQNFKIFRKDQYLETMEKRKEIRKEKEAAAALASSSPTNLD